VQVDIHRKHTDIRPARTVHTGAAKPSLADTRYRNEDCAATTHPDAVRSAKITEDAYELLQRGKDLLARRHAHQAAVVLERAQTVASESGSVRETLGRAYYAAGRYRAAAEVFNEAVQRDPANDYGHFALALSLLKTGEPTRAIGHLRLAVAMRPHSATYQRALSRATGHHGHHHGQPQGGSRQPDQPDSDRHDHHPRGEE
jgi:predicted Zn-dependent protease